MTELPRCGVGRGRGVGEQGLGTSPRWVQGGNSSSRQLARLFQGRCWSGDTRLRLLQDSWLVAVLGDPSSRESPGQPPTGNTQASSPHPLHLSCRLHSPLGLLSSSWKRQVCSVSPDGPCPQSSAADHFLSFRSGWRLRFWLCSFIQQGCFSETGAKLLSKNGKACPWGGVPG